MNSAAAAEDSTPKATYIDKQPIVVTATRTTQPLSQAASSLSVLTEQDIQEDQPVTLGELLLDIPTLTFLTLPTYRRKFQSEDRIPLKLRI